MNTSNKLLLGMLITILLFATILMGITKLNSKPRVIDLTAPPREAPAVPETLEVPDAPDVP